MSLRSFWIGPALLVLGACASAPEPQAVVEPPRPEPAPPPSAAQIMERERPLPYPLTYPVEYQRAIARGTRTPSGAPGGDYWQQWADYRIDARLDPRARRLEATAEIVYHNRSPNPLGELYVNLIQNFHAPGGIRTEEAEITGGVELGRVAADGADLRELRAAMAPGPGYSVTGTLMRIAPARPVPPGGTVTLSFDWAFDVPEAGAGARMGWNRDDLFFLAYWYPHMAVYDDVIGWHTDYFRGTAEFYSGFGSYDITIEAPEQWLVLATGDLRNPEEVLQPQVLERFRRAAGSDDVVRVVTEDDFGRITRQEPGGVLTWRFVADSVRDVAFSATRESNWDVTRTPVGDRDGDGDTDYARIDAVWRPTAPKWSEAARYAAHSIDFLSRWTATPYPWPHMTAVEGGGIIGGGMEFPMMTLIGDYNASTDSALYYVTAHELAHMWVPMIVSTNERRYSWLDEGTTTFNENQAKMEFFPGRDHDLDDQASYIQWAMSGREQPMAMWSDFMNSGAAFGIASYSKPATVLTALKALVGEDQFLRAYHEFFDRWAFKHAYPWDLFNTFEDVLGQDLDWFWRSWYYEGTEDGPWVLEQGIAEVETGPGGTARVEIVDRGWIPMPVDLVVTREGGATERYTVPVSRWLEGHVRATVEVPAGAPIQRIEIDPERDFPDVVRDNNVWRATTS